jgi:hypothetical protein
MVRIMDELISYKMCAVKVRNAKLRNYLKEAPFGSLQLLVEFEVDLVRRHFRVVRVENSWCFLHKRTSRQNNF